MKRFIIILASLFSATKMLAQGTSSPSLDSIAGMPVDMAMLIGLIMFFIVVVIVVLLAITIDLGRFSRSQMIKDGAHDLPWVIKLFGIFDGDTTSLTSEYKDEVLEDHDYDGIHEYDNDLPPWWKALFYITVVFAVIYIGNYHFFHFWGEASQAAEYAAEEKEAAEKYANVDLVYDEASSEAAVLTEGKQLFMDNCKACHGEFGQGGIGANLTDKFWIYGGNINDVYKTVKYGGRAGSGMQAWESDFSNAQIYAISSFVKGFKYHEGKEPQGEEYTEEK